MKTQRNDRPPGSMPADDSPYGVLGGRSLREGGLPGEPDHGWGPSAMERWAFRQSMAREDGRLWSERADERRQLGREDERRWPGEEEAP